MHLGIRERGQGVFSAGIQEDSAAGPGWTKEKMELSKVVDWIRQCSDIALPALATELPQDVSCKESLFRSGISTTP